MSYRLKAILIAFLILSALVVKADAKSGFSTALPKLKEQCAVACYTDINNQYVVAGYYATDGIYTGRICRPDGFMGDISPKDSTYSAKCSSTVEYCKTNVCWAGGDTGGFYGRTNETETAINSQSFQKLAAIFESVEGINAAVTKNEQSIQQLAANQDELLYQINCSSKVVISLLVTILICALACVIMLWKMYKRSTQEEVKAQSGS